MKQRTRFFVVADLLGFAAPAFPAAKPNMLVIPADDPGYGESGGGESPGVTLAEYARQQPLKLFTATKGTEMPKAIARHEGREPGPVFQPERDRRHSR